MKDDKVVPFREERRQAETFDRDHVNKCFELISKIASVKEELGGMVEGTQTESYEVAAMVRADKKIMAVLDRFDLEYMFPFPSGWRWREQFRGWPEATPDAETELSDEELKWQKELDAAIFDLVIKFAPAYLVVDASCQKDWIRELRNHIECVYGVFADAA